jgi:hypothetical protein
MYFSQRLDCWVVEGYAEAEAVMREPGLEIPRLPLPKHILDADEQAALAPIWEQVDHTPLYSAGAAHLRLRRELKSPFAQRAVQNWRPLIRRTASRLIEQRLPAGHLEVMDDVGRPLLREVMAQVVGIPKRMRPEFHRHAQAAMDVGKLGTPDWSQEVLTRACRATNALEDLVDRLLSRPKGVPRGSVLSTAIARRGMPGALSVPELATNLRSLYTAGLYTTIPLVGSSTYLLFADEAVLAAVRSDRQVVASVVRETLRFACPAVEVNVRRATRDTMIGSHRINSGQFVRTVVLRASRDPKQFRDPEIFDLERPREGRELAYGTGPHICLGKHLATAVAEEICAVLADSRYAARLLAPLPTFVRRAAIPVMWGPNWVNLELGPSTEGAGG